MKKAILTLTACVYVMLAHAQLKGDTTGTYYDKDSLTVLTEFNGGIQKWADFLLIQLDRDITKKNNAPDGSYKVNVQIITNESGKIVYTNALNDPGYGTKDEAIRVIWRSNGRWKPSFKNNIPVKSARVISITFVVN